MITRYTLVLLLLICCCTAVQGQQRKKLLPRTDTTIYMLTYGLFSGTANGLYDYVAAKYGFQYLSVGGCVVDQETRCCVGRLNEITRSYLNLVNGEGWEQQFEQEVAVYKKLQDSAIAMAERMPYVIKTQKEQEKLGYALVFEPGFSASHYVCTVDVFGWDNSMGIVSLCKLEVNTAEKKVKILSNKPAPCYYCPRLNAI